jgi:hypothetical protein
MKKHFPRLLPSLVLAGLLAFTLMSSSGGAVSPPASPMSNYPANLPCTMQLESSPSTLDYTVELDHGVLQPLGEVTNIAACSLTVTPYSYSAASMRVVYWDPQALTPEPGTVALRTLSSSATYLTTTKLRFDWSPPLIQKVLPGVGEPPNPHLALDYHVLSYANQQVLSYDPDAPGVVPGAAPSMLQYTGAGAPTLVAGNHPVLGHTVCGGDAWLQSLSVAQSVVSTDALLDSTYQVLAQKFRLPAPVQLQWLEVAFGYGPFRVPFDYASVAILDAQGQSTPPSSSAGALASQYFYVYPINYGAGGARWETHNDFGVTPTLQANHDYWLYMDVHHDYATWAKNLTGFERPEFKERIGPLYTSTYVGGPWTHQTAYALSFRLIGTSLGTTDVPLPPRGESSFRLGVSPNPARGLARVSWSGAAGAAWIEVLDPRGRRVSRAEGAPGGRGEWVWRGVDEAGRALPAGVYFVHAVDDAGRSSSVRVVLVR